MGHRSDFLHSVYLRSPPVISGYTSTTCSDSPFCMIQGVHHGCEGETYRATHVHLCAEEGASFPIYRSTTQSIVTMCAQSLRRMAGIISVSSVGVWPTSSLFGRPFPHRYLQQRAFPCDRRALTAICLSGSTGACYTRLPERRSWRANQQAEKGTD
jgi:hypothetical protein